MIEFLDLTIAFFDRIVQVLNFLFTSWIIAYFFNFFLVARFIYFVSLFFFKQQALFNCLFKSSHFVWYRSGDRRLFIILQLFETLDQLSNERKLSPGLCCDGFLLKLCLECS